MYLRRENIILFLGISKPSALKRTLIRITQDVISGNAHVEIEKEKKRKCSHKLIALISRFKFEAMFCVSTK